MQAVKPRNKTTMYQAIVAAIGLLAAANVAMARPELYLPDVIYATYGVECNVYFKNVTDAIVPGRYGWNVRCDIGRQEESRWTWFEAKPDGKDAGSPHRLVVEMWDDEHGVVAAATTSVQVVKAPADKSRPIRLALFADSLTNCRYQNYLYEMMEKNGFSDYLPVGTRPFDNAGDKNCRHEARHDGYGGWTWFTFLTRYSLTEEEVSAFQSEAERAQMKKFGVQLPEGQKWRAGLLKSPIVRIKDGKRVVDVQGFFDRENDGKAPDYLVIELGTNDMFMSDDANRAEKVSWVRECAKKLVAAMRSAAPDMKIGVMTIQPGQNQDAFGRHYRCAQTEWNFRSNILAYDRMLQDMVRESGDPNLFVIPGHVAVDTDHNYITYDEPPNRRATTKTTRGGNAVHPDLPGGKQMADAIYSWIMAVESGKARAD